MPDHIVIVDSQIGGPTPDIHQGHTSLLLIIGEDSST